ncbi:endonuclease/exonuclease/phosphatase family protein [Paractinoplanes durhamensis]|uniref:Endonuclease n=1 Tax=Paractinoplanes durhamensis TaxID=113563 RepID=A0ABQ3YN99_9ACTN|nr:endonuclease/exonuclease/phosphatase family protein [Actinoplanes durhamensis]GID99015.1 endonuclease [Actinoplanes durhamensis]
MKIISTAAVVRPVHVPKEQRKVVSVLLWLLVVPALVWLVLRVGGWERGLLVQLMAFTPYVALWSLVPTVLAVGFRRWPTAAVAFAIVLAFAVLVMPRARTSDQGPSQGVELHVMTSNMRIGGADPATIVRLVRENKVDVLALQEFSPSGRRGLEKNGLLELLPYSSLGDEPGASGSGIYSRFPLTGAGDRRYGGGFRQAYGTIQPLGAGPVLFESVHPRAPVTLPENRLWQADLAEEPQPEADGPPRVLLGDFNATLDHRSMRKLVDAGYRDAGDATGTGLVTTWPYMEHRGVPKVTIDHVLVDRRIGVRQMSAHRIPNTDHRALIAVITVPAA